MKKVLNIAAPVVIGTYTMTFLATVSHPNPSPYFVVTAGLVFFACVVWFICAAADWNL